MPTITRGHRNLLATTATLATLLIALGGMVCATDSSSACPDWPGCFGRIVPPPNLNAILEYTHRLVAGVTGLLILVSAYLGLRRARAIPAVAWPPLLAIPLTAAVALFGRAAVLTGLPRHLAVLDLGSALLILALMIAASVTACAVYAAAGIGVPAAANNRAIAFRSSRNATLALAAFIALYCLFISGILTAGVGSLTRCIGWPMLALIPTDVTGWPQVLRLLFALVVAGLIFLLAFRVVRTGAPLADRRLALFAPIVLLAEVILDLLILVRGPTLFLELAHVSLAAILYALLAALAVRLRLPVMPVAAADATPHTS